MPDNDCAYTMPHCDPSILHAPGACQYCDRHPDWQRLRDLWRINCTNENDPDKAPCPSAYFRNPAVRDRWYGNVAYPVGSQPPSMFEWTPPS